MKCNNLKIYALVFCLKKQEKFNAYKVCKYMHGLYINGFKLLN